MKNNMHTAEDNILNYLYENKFDSPQSLTKIRLALDLEDNRCDVRILKTGLNSLTEKGFIKKQENRGNYKIEAKGIEHIEKT
jgi:predicted transcriptional regulator